jgi:hypothetical protein
VADSHFSLEGIFVEIAGNILEGIHTKYKNVS